MDWRKITYFRKSEFACRHCGECHMDESFVILLDKIRWETGLPIRITSGYRCKEYDDKLGGSGNHPLGRAADISVVSSKHKFMLVKAALKQGIRRIGIGKTFIHLDTNTEDDEKPQDVLWTY